MSAITLTAKELRRAADIREQIDELETELATLLNHSDIGISSRVGGARRRGMSAAGRARVAAAAKARWAAYRKAEDSKPGARIARKKSKFGPAARAALSAAAKARWARAKAEGKVRL